MVARVIAAEVLELLPSNKDDQVIESSFINSANIFVDTHLLSAGHSAAVLKQVELYLAAHFLCLAEEKGGMILDKIGDATQEYQEIYEAGFRSTRFGQQAVAWDTSGILVGLSNNKLKASFVVV